MEKKSRIDFKGFLLRLNQTFLCRNIIWEMSISQLKAKHAASILGIYLAMINPLLVMAVITFVFSAVFKVQINNFPIFVLSGIIPWMFFSNAISEASASIINQQGILRQYNIPREALPLSVALSGFHNFLIGWLVLYPVFIFFNPRIIFLFPFFLAILVLNLILVCGFSLILSVVCVFVREISNLLPIMMMFWFWITPVFYSVEMVPENLRWVCFINPMSIYVVFYREILFAGHAPSLSILCGVFLWGLAIFAIGILIFFRFEGKFLKNI